MQIFLDFTQSWISLPQLISKKKYGEISRILNLGDVLERGTSPKEVLEKMEELYKNNTVI